ncbi:MAG: GNAT family N-acetyltransferase [Flavobacterium sp.]|uniref:GNAT family N-acetyltransferase n=1 Tax=Flavobacterium sp. TaxID=239 RepID=UPI0022BBD378|nr:GNAT family N-acetyltransferase [Flavobacterium sp.]MCZ8198266.1 GNAT family N-acetyltransferase [Flavobacterium sp.]
MTTFQPLENHQIETITKMMQDFYAIDNYPIDIAVSKKLFQEFISDEKLGKAWLIYSDEELVGYVILTYVFSFEYKGRIAFLDELYIKETYRGKGIGKQTIDFIKEQASNQNVKLIYLEVENHNQNAQKLYLANDFEVHNRKLLKHKLS